MVIRKRDQKRMGVSLEIQWVMNSLQFGELTDIHIYIICVCVFSLQDECLVALQPLRVFDICSFMVDVVACLQEIFCCLVTVLVNPALERIQFVGSIQLPTFA